MPKNDPEKLIFIKIDSGIATLLVDWGFDINVDSDLLPESLKIIFHSTVAKLIYTSTRTRQDLLTTISFLSKRVSNPTHEDWRKLREL